MIWSSWIITKIHRLIEAEMQCILPISILNYMHDGASVDGINFDDEDVFRFIAETFGLT
jgi:hypothetical protein